jgi:hypothetical protein
MIGSQLGAFYKEGAWYRDVSLFKVLGCWVAAIFHITALSVEEDNGTDWSLFAV